MPNILEDEADASPDDADLAASAWKAAAASFTAADFAVFDDALGCLMDEACEAFHAKLKEQGATDPHAVPCLMDDVCGAKYRRLAERMREAPCEPNSVCPSGRCNLKNPRITPPGCRSLVLGRMSRGGILSSHRHGALYVGEVNDGAIRGIGSIRNRDGTIYAGEIHDGAPGSFGRYRYVDLGFYEGQFANGAPNGTGYYRASRHEGWYRGGVMKGKAHGRGTVATGDGVELEGEFDRGRPNPRAKRVVRLGSDAAPLGSVEARATYDSKLDDWQHVLDRLAQRATAKGGSDPKLQELPDEYYFFSTAVALLLPLSLTVLTLFAPSSKGKRKGVPAGKKTR